MNKEEISKYMSTIGRKGGLARNKHLTPERIKAIAVNAVQTRWNKVREQKELKEKRAKWNSMQIDN